MLRVMRVRKYSLHSMHSWWKTQDFSKIESGPNYTTAAHAFVKATLRLGLWAPFVARKNALMLSIPLVGLDRESMESHVIHSN